jgi:hypothetical protein
MWGNVQRSSRVSQGVEADLCRKLIFAILRLIMKEHPIFYLGSSENEVLQEIRTCTDPSLYSHKKYLTVTRLDVISYLKAHPEEAAEYFRRRGGRRTAAADAELLYEEDGEYVSSSVDHGTERSVRRFKNLPEAVAEDVLVSFGMY